MSVMIREEADFLLVSVFWGIGLTAIYDLLRILRTAVRHASFFVAAEDFLYWIFAGFALFYLLFSMNDGKLRWFSLAGAGAGMWLYHITLSPILVKLLGAAMGYLLRWIWFPIKTVFRLLKKPTKWLTMKIRVNLKKQSQTREKKDRGEKNEGKQKKKKIQ